LFEGEEEAEAEFVVEADGIHSWIRPFLAPEANHSLAAQWVSWEGWAKLETNKDELKKMQSDRYVDSGLSGCDGGTV
jgi:2-polyprenyl-6-methoxyphenol hydroxylase-like FAD-dependent oxidoreductase